ncbi:MAG: hypothetical protein WC876_02490 [Candidatus Thermoplasmatota archaeon]|jgi:hypothetical protein
MMPTKKPTKKPRPGLPDVDELDNLVAQSDALLKQQENLERKANKPRAKK